MLPWVLAVLAILVTLGLLLLREWWRLLDEFDTELRADDERRRREKARRGR